MKLIVQFDITGPQDRELQRLGGEQLAFGAAQPLVLGLGTSLGGGHGRAPSCCSVADPELNLWGLTTGGSYESRGPLGNAGGWSLAGHPAGSQRATRSTSAAASSTGRSRLSTTWSSTCASSSRPARYSATSRYHCGSRPASLALIRAFTTSSGARSRTTVIAAPGTASVVGGSRLQGLKNTAQQQQAGTCLLEVSAHAGQIAVDQFLVPRIIRRRWPAAADHREIHHGVPDSCLAQEARASAVAAVYQSDRPGYQEDRNDRSTSVSGDDAQFAPNCSHECGASV